MRGMVFALLGFAATANAADEMQLLLPSNFAIVASLDELPGAGNDVAIRQSGDNNWLSVDQTGVRNVAQIVQSGSGGRVDIVQSGSGNTALVHQH